MYLESRDSGHFLPTFRHLDRARCGVIAQARCRSHTPSGCGVRGDRRRRSHVVPGRRLGRPTVSGQEGRGRLAIPRRGRRRPQRVGRVPPLGVTTTGTVAATARHDQRVHRRTLPREEVVELRGPGGLPTHPHHLVTAPPALIPIPPTNRDHQRQVGRVGALLTLPLHLSPRAQVDEVGIGDQLVADAVRPLDLRQEARLAAQAQQLGRAETTDHLHRADVQDVVRQVRPRLQRQAPHEARDLVHRALVSRGVAAGRHQRRIRAAGVTAALPCHQVVLYLPSSPTTAQSEQRHSPVAGSIRPPHESHTTGSPIRSHLLPTQHGLHPALQQVRGPPHTHVLTRVRERGQP